MLNKNKNNNTADFNSVSDHQFVIKDEFRTNK